MGRLKRLLAAGAVLFLAAAGSPAEAPERLPLAALSGRIADMGLKPGLWRTSARMVAGDATPLAPERPLPPQLAEKLHALIGRLFESQSCYDPDAAPKDALILPQIQISGDECVVAKAELADGRIDLDIVCNQPADGFENRVRLRGVYTADSLNLTTETDSAVRKQGLRLVTTLSSNSARIGPCPPTPVAPPAPPTHKPKG